MKKNFRVFVPMTKVDEEKRLVYGTITEEVLDKSGETMDYETSKPLFEKWSEGIAQASGGKSMGNVRVMHTPKAAGKLTDIAYDDDGKKIEACAKIVDDGEWQKVVEGVYTGFSIGGRYAKKWEEDGNKKFTADPVEVSLVDNPCVPTATFQMIKADGVEVDVPFHLWAPSNEDLLSKAHDLAREGGDEDKWPDFITAARDDLIKAKAKESDGEDDSDEDDAEKSADLSAAPKAKGEPEPAADKAAEGGIDDDDDAQSTDDKKPPAKKKAKKDAAELSDEDKEALQKAALDAVSQVWTCTDGQTFAKKADAVAHELTLTEPPSAIDKALAKANAVLNKKDPAEAVEPEPVELFKAETPVAEPLAKLVGADLRKSIAAVDAIRRAVEVARPLEKSLYTVSEVACLLRDLSWIAQSVVCEEHYEGDSGSQLPQQVTDLLQSLRSFLVTMVTEETAELLTSLKTQGGDNVQIVIAEDDADVMELATQISDLVKADTVLMEKAGARHNKADAETIQKMHDHSVQLGATCDGVEKADDALELQKRDDRISTLEGQLEKVAPTIEALTKRIEEIENSPMPAAPRGSHVIGKGEDAGGAGGDDQVMDVLQKLAPEQLSLLAIKLSQQKGMSKLPS